MKHPFTDSELVTIFEAARISLANAELRDELAAEMDIADAELLSLYEKLENYMEDEAEIRRDRARIEREYFASEQEYSIGN